MKTYIAYYYDVDRVCVEQVTIQARNYKEAASKARKTEAYQRKDVASFDVEGSDWR